MSNSSDDRPWYPYEPNTTMPVVVGAIFTVGFVYHLAVSIFKGSFAYWWAFVAGCLVEAAGYFVRKMSADHPAGDKYKKWYIIQQLAIIIAPALLAASMYMAYGRVITYVGRHMSPLKHVTAIFVTCDILSFVIQGIGGGMFSSTNEHTVKLAKTVLMIGFLIQILAFSLFLIVSIVFRSRASKAGINGSGWAGCLYGLWLAGIAILVRSIYRTAEFATGSSSNGQQTGYLLTHEKLFYCLETIPIVLSVAILAISHPSFYLPRSKRQTLEPMGLPISDPKPWGGKNGYY